VSRPFRFAVLAGLGLITDGIVDLLTSGRRILRSQEKLMAEFANLRAALADQRDELVAAVDRVAADVQALQDKISELELDTADQAQIDELAGQVRDSVETLRGIDPVKAVDEAPEEPAEPAVPASPVDPNA
jgi:peptidoglycan hydrolase CwlO-like protein